MNILALHSNGITAAKIFELANASKRTVYHYFAYLSKRRFGNVYLYDKCKHPSELEKFADVIVNDLIRCPNTACADIFCVKGNFRFKKQSPFFPPDHNGTSFT
ncbi:MAG: hypothetical protein LBJ67_05775 [Planctomycetaceae bacterium]|jgi:hypothetical protein|nr:hypothetical protein [Planctomycetaceae bacterium]